MNIANLHADMQNAMHRFVAEMQKTSPAALGEYPDVAQDLLGVLNELTRLSRPGPAAEPSARAELELKLKGELLAAWSGVAGVVGVEVVNVPPAVPHLVGAAFGVLARALCEQHERLARLESAGERGNDSGPGALSVGAGGI